MILKYKFTLLTLISFVALACISCDRLSYTSSDDMQIWFDKPTQKWNSGLPIGNGRLGAMLYGTPQKELITLNEETIWSGNNDYYGDKTDGNKYISKVRSLISEGKHAEAEALTTKQILSESLPSGTSAYQMLGRLTVLRPLEEIENFRTSLNIETATTHTQFESDGVTYHREAFASAPANAIMIRYTANKKNAINFSLSLRRTDNTKVKINEHQIVFSEKVNNGKGVAFYAVVDIENINGTIKANSDFLEINNASEVILKIVAASDYNNLNPKGKVLADLELIQNMSYKELRSQHIEDYKKYYDRVEIKLADKPRNDIPTDQRLGIVKNNTRDNYLTQLQYQYGRYLLISSSRPGSMPANLQGLWVEDFKPPWNSDYHINVNMQMNYWPAEMTNLSECHEPFLQFVADLREKGRVTARETYGCGGFVAHHSSDIWHMTRASGNPQYGMWPMGAAWCCQHLFEHYRYTNDTDYLRNNAYPVMKEAAQFFVDYLVENPETGYLMVGPSCSPENAFVSDKGEVATVALSTTMNESIIVELFTNCIASARVLNIDGEFVSLLEDKLTRVAPLEISENGRLLEWSLNYKEQDAGHRHISHLYALHPSNQISKHTTPDLFDAARATIDYRLKHGGDHTGWSRAWVINFWARLLDGNKALQNIMAQQKKSTLPNLLDLHPPFQIDGNFGLVAGVTEMLMQSHNDEVVLLPALPDAWSEGSIKGIVARGGFVVDIEWKDGQLYTAQITSSFGLPLTVRLHNKTVAFNTKEGEVLKFNNKLEKK